MFGQATAAPEPSRRPAKSSPDNPATIEDGSENATRRQLVQVLMRDVLRRSGIPPEWIECQMLLVSSRTRGQGMYVRLVLRHWDHRMMNYTVAFQRALITDIERFEPKALEWLHGISWQLEVDDTCPYTELPEKSFWLTPAKTPLVAPLLPEVGAEQVIPGVPQLRVQGTEEDEKAELAKQAGILPPPDEDDPARDLERLFAIRDQELDRQTVEGVTPVGYENTQPSPL